MMSYMYICTACTKHWKSSSFFILLRFCIKCPVLDLTCDFLNEFKDGTVLYFYFLNHYFVSILLHVESPAATATTI